MKKFNEHGRTEWDFTTKQNTHGDVIIEKASLPVEFASLPKEEKDTLAYGEATGHSHRLFRIPDKEGADLPSFDLRVGVDGNRWLKVFKPTELKHQEHDVRVIPPGEYKIKIQREYNPWTKLIRKVVD